MVFPFSFWKAAVAGGPTQIAADNFDAYSNGAALESQTGWASVQGSFAVQGGAVTANTAATDISIQYSGATFNADQYSTAATTALGGAVIGLSVRNQTGSVNLYNLYYDNNTGFLSLNVVNAGTRTNITFIAKTYAAGTKLWLQAVGVGSATRLTAREDTGSGWVDVWTNQDPGGTYINGGKPGVAGNGTGAGNYLDNWSAGNT